MPTDIQKQENFRHIIRLLEADMKGEKKILPSLKRIKGVSFSFANAICNILDLDLKRQVGTLSDEELNNITDIVKNPKKYNIPSWLFNRVKDLDTGDDKHLTGSELRLQKEFDIKHLKKIKCYRGIRHSQGLPVRGQRTRGNFRHGKTIGVRRKGMPTGNKKEGDSK
jgi:small subunit ribosomal protein S13